MSRYRKHFSHVEEKADADLLLELQRKSGKALEKYLQSITPVEAGKGAEAFILNTEKVLGLVRGSLESEIVDYSNDDIRMQIVYNTLPVTVSFEDNILRVRTQLTTNFNGAERHHLCRKVEAAFYKYEKDNGINLMNTGMKYPLSALQIRHVKNVSASLRDSDNESIVIMNCIVSALGLSDNPRVIPNFSVLTDLVETDEEVCSEFILFSYEKKKEFDKLVDEMMSKMQKKYSSKIW